MRLWPLLMLGLMFLTACVGSGEPGRLYVDERIETAHFKLTVERRCLGRDEVKKALVELHSSKVKLLELVGDYIRPGDFEARRPEAPASPPEVLERRPQTGFLPTIAPIPVRIVDRKGRSFTDRRGIEVVKHYLGRHDLTHELVHYLCGASWAPVDEGLAVYLTEQLKGPDKGASVDLRSVVYRDLNKLKSFDPARLAKGMTRIDYDAAGSFVKFLVERYGWARFFQLYHGPQRNYFWVYGRSEHDLIYQWQRSLSEKKLRRSRPYYIFRARITTGLQGAGAPTRRRD